MILRNLKIGPRLGAGFAIIILLTLGLSLFLVWKIEKLAVDTEQMYYHSLVVNNAVRDIKADIIAIHGTMKDVAMAEDKRQLKKNIELVKEYEDKILLNFKQVEDRFLGDKQDVVVARRFFIQWKYIRDDVLYYVQVGDLESGARITRTDGANHVRLLHEKIQIMIDFAGREAKRLVESSVKSSHEALIDTVVILAVVLIVTIILSILITRSISRPLDRMTESVEKISRGDLEVSLESGGRDELSRMATSISALLTNMSDLARAASFIAFGDFNVKVTPRSDRDTLGIAMQDMAETLRRTAAIAHDVSQGDLSVALPVKSENDLLAGSINSMIDSLQESERQNIHQNWVTSGLTFLDEEMRGEDDLGVLSKKIITLLCTYIGAQMGAFYIFHEQNRLLQLNGSYALPDKNVLNKEIMLGEGLIGEAALQKELITLTEVPEDYVRIVTAIGNTLPRNILILPFFHEDRLKGIVEFAALDEFPAKVIEFLKITAKSIGIAVSVSQSRDRLQELLKESKQRAEELQIREEELKATNEELESQTVSLHASQKKMEDQQAELEATNSELEEKSLTLEDQKKKIESRNRALVTAREEIEERARDLALASKYKSEFMANMSHELRTPLNSLLLLAQSLNENRDDNLTADQLQAAAIIYDSGRDLLELINDILDLSKIEAGRMDIELEEISLKELADSSGLLFSHMASEKGLTFEVSINDGLQSAITSDLGRIEQIIKNFLSNAIKFTESGGVTLGFSRVTDDISLATSGLAPERAIAISVADTGIGIPVDQQKVIFEAFQQGDGSTARQFGGTGLGLSISRELASLIGGEIQVTSTPGSGSTFTLYLPLSVEKGTQPDLLPAAREPDKAVAGESRSEEVFGNHQELSSRATVEDDRDHLDGEQPILIIEDDEHFAALLRDQCHERGFKALVSGSGEAGLEIAEHYQPAGIILDIRLPGIDGWVVLSHLKSSSRTRHIPVHIVSADEAGSNAFKLGAIGFLTKPLNREQIAEIFGRFEAVINREFKELLVVEDDDTLRDVIIGVIGNGDVRATPAKNGKEAEELLRNNRFDCMVLDLGLPDIPGLELLQKLAEKDSVAIPPVIIYTGRDLTRQEEMELRKYSRSIIIKDDRSKERLLDEVSLFLHRMVEKMPEQKQQIIADLHNRDLMFKNKKILLVDDDMRNVFALSTSLEDKGIQVLIAEDGRKALEVLDSSPDIDLVLMDIMMPVMDGYETMRRIREKEEFWKLPVIALTAKAMKDDREKCIEAGASDYLAKPVDLERLFSMMRVWLYR
ncbi:MAG: response regulator [Thermodesulfobacteriota bacterium]